MTQEIIASKSSIKQLPTKPTTDELMTEVKKALSLLVECEASALVMDRDQLEHLIDHSFWTSTLQAFKVINSEGELITIKQTDVAAIWTRTFPGWLNTEALLATLLTIPSKANTYKRLESAIEIASKIVGNYLKGFRRGETITCGTDYFAKTTTIEPSTSNRVIVTFPGSVFAVDEAYVNPVYINDFKEHFPEFDEFIDLTVSARFASNRKNAYLWLHAPSNWGKGLLTQVYKDLGLCQSITMNELRALGNGSNCAKSPDSFQDCWILLLNECRGIKSEFKELETTIKLSPKYQLENIVPVYLKLITSADNIPSLVGEDGVEDQLALRVSMMRKEGPCSINDRPLFSPEQRHLYYKALVCYVSERLNTRIHEMVALGRDGAIARAAAELAAFSKKYGLSNTHSTLSQVIPGIAQDVVRWLVEGSSSIKPVIGKKDGKRYLPNARKAVSEYIDAHYDRSEKTALMARISDFYAHMSADGQGNKSRKVNGIGGRAILLKDEGMSETTAHEKYRAGLYEVNSRQRAAADDPDLPF